MMKENKIKDWCEEHALGLMCLGMIVFIVVASVLAFDKLVLLYEDFVTFSEMVKQNREYASEVRGEVLYSEDCERIQSGLSSLLSKGANSDSWFPNRDDSALKNGLERYAILC